VAEAFSVCEGRKKMNIPSSEEKIQDDIPPEVRVLMEKSRELSEKFKVVLLDFCQRNSTLPAQLVMASIGELLIQFSTAHVGPAMTNEFLKHLQTVLKDNDGAHPYHSMQ
jgi:hypothetical protein